MSKVLKHGGGSDQMSLPGARRGRKSGGAKVTVVGAVGTTPLLILTGRSGVAAAPRDLVQA